MTIRYTKKRLRVNLMLGLLWFVLAMAQGFFDDFDNWINLSFMGIALLYLGQYVLESRNQYLTITENQIKANSPFGKRIPVSDITRIKKFGGDYILETDSKKLTINTLIIDQEALIDLNTFLAKINLPPEKTPFTNNNTSLV